MCTSYLQKFLFHIREDVGDVFVFFDLFKELFDFLALFVGDGFHHVGDAFELEALDFVLVVFQIFLDGTNVKLLQPSNAEPPIEVTLLGIIKSVTNSLFKYNFAPLNGLSLNLILHHAAKSFIYTPVNPLQSENALHPIVVTLFPMVTDVNLLQPSNA